MTTLARGTCLTPEPNGHAFWLTPQATLDIEGDPPLEVFSDTLRYVANARDMLGWALGALMMDALTRYGEPALLQVLDARQISRESGRRYLRVYQAFKPSERHLELSWRHHDAVYTLPPEKREQLLNQAERDDLPSDVVRELAKEERGETARAPRTCKWCGKEPW